jgi:glycosyltransferase involved in cell wall biosynthesis
LLELIVTEPLISTIVPCFNQARFLPEVTASLQAQLYPRWECIIVNDGSSDDTAQVARGLAAADSRIRLVGQENRGLAAARNRGLCEAKGQFVHFLDADDYILPEMYQKMVEVFTTSSDLSVVYCGYQFVDSDRKFLKSFPALPEPSDVFHQLLERNPWPCHAIMVRKTAIDSAGPFEGVFYGCEDWDLWLRIASLGGRFAPVNGEFACYRRYPNSMSKNACRMLSSGLAVIESNLDRHKACRLCKASASRGKDRWRLECWNGLCSGLERSRVVQRTVRYARFLLQVATMQPQAACSMLRILFRKCVVAPALARIKSQALNL